LLKALQSSPAFADLAQGSSAANPESSETPSPVVKTPWLDRFTKFFSFGAISSRASASKGEADMSGGAASSSHGRSLPHAFGNRRPLGLRDGLPRSRAQMIYGGADMSMGSRENPVRVVSVDETKWSTLLWKTLTQFFWYVHGYDESCFTPDCS